MNGGLCTIDDLSRSIWEAERSFSKVSSLVMLPPMLSVRQEVAIMIIHIPLQDPRM
jgi:hypothetical protein